MNKLAVVTGGTKGLGHAVAERLLGEGFDVLLTFGSDEERAESVRKALTSAFAGSEIAVIQADASSMNSIDAIEGYLEAHERQVDALVLNAGLTARGSLGRVGSSSRWDRVFRANVDVPLFTIQRLIGYFCARRINRVYRFTHGLQPHSMSLALRSLQIGRTRSGEEPREVLGAGGDSCECGCSWLYRY